jgi:hypothetical protein
MVPSFLGLALVGATSATLRVAVVPFVPLGSSSLEAKRLERIVRGDVAEMPGIELLSLGEVANRLANAPPPALNDCHDDVCAVRFAEALGIDGVITGVVSELGGATSLALTYTMRGGAGARHASTDLSQSPTEVTSAVEHAIRGLLGMAPALAPGASAQFTDTGITQRVLRPAPIGLFGGAALTTGAGGALGLFARDTQAGIDARQTGCPGTGDAYFDCFSSRVQTGRNEALAANVLFVSAGVLAAAALTVVLWPQHGDGNADGR